MSLAFCVSADQLFEDFCSDIRPHICSDAGLWRHDGPDVHEPAAHSIFALYIIIRQNTIDFREPPSAPPKSEDPR